MRFRVLIVVVAIAVAVHAVIFVALGHIAKDKGPLMPAPAAPASAHAKGQQPQQAPSSS